MTDDFVHLHVHDEYSMLDGAMGVSPLVGRAKALGQGAVAQTNHGNLFGAYDFHKECLAQGVKPIIGMEAYVAPASRFDRTRVSGFSGSGSYSHLTLLAQGPGGARNLFKLSSLAYSEGFYSKPRIDLSLLDELQEGLLIGSGCLSGELLTYLQRTPDGEGQADEYLGMMKERFGEKFFIEIMDHNFAREAEHIPELVAQAKRHNIRLVATNDAHYLEEGDGLLHDAMLCIGTYAKLSDEKRMRFDGEGYFLKNRAQMERLSLPAESLDNTLWVASQIGNYGDVFDNIQRMPKWIDPLGWTAEERLRNAIGISLDSMFPEGSVHPDKELLYVERAEYEMDVICSQGFADYFLIISDIVAYAKGRGITVGPGRGSAAGSLVAFLMGITGLDPMAHGLLFERFLNPDRVSLPDIDVDFQASRRDEVYKYAIEKYGADKCARIVTISRIKAKAALNDSTRILGREYGAGARLAQALPDTQAGRTPSLSEGDRSRIGDTESWELAERLEGLARGTGVHPSAFVISPIPLVELVPTFVPSRDDPAISTQYDMHGVEGLGLVKFDFLNLETLDVIEDALRPAGVELPTSFEDPRTYELLRTGNTLGVFQLDSPGMRGLLRRLGPRSLDDIAAVISLYRPGPMGVDAHLQFADRRNGKQMVSYPHPELGGRLGDILAPTYGVIVYQEQVMQVLQRVAGYTLAQADLVRKIMGKKDRELLARERAKYFERADAAGLSMEAASALWDTLVPFADYGFNKSHGYGYAYLAYWTAWLKANHPKALMASVLTHADDPDKTAEYLAEVTRMKIPILPPDVNAGAAWHPTKEGISYGLTSIRGVGKKVSTPLLRYAPYHSWDDFLHRAPAKALNMGVVKALAQAGALDSLGSREGILRDYTQHVADVLLERAQRSKGELGFGRRSFTPASLPVDWGVRAEQERAALGVSLSAPPAVLYVPNGLERDEWQYIRTAIQANPGSSRVTIKNDSWQMDTGMSADRERIERTLLALRVTLL